MSILEKGRSRSKYNETLDEIHGLNYANIWERSNTRILFLRVHAMRQPADSASTADHQTLSLSSTARTTTASATAVLKAAVSVLFISFFTGSVTCFSKSFYACTIHCFCVEKKIQGSGTVKLDASFLFYLGYGLVDAR